MLEAGLEDRFSRAPDPGFRARATSEYRRIFGWVRDLIDLNSATILDFGCGQGIAAASFALRHPNSRILAHDIAPISTTALSKVLRQQIDEDLPENIEFIQPTLLQPGTVDLIYAWSVFEHVSREDIVATLRLLSGLLSQSGVMFIHCEPLYFSPAGSHLYKYFDAPWHHLLTSIETLRNTVISEQAKEREAREWQQFIALNRVTSHDIERYINEANLTIMRRQLFATEALPPDELRHVYNDAALSTTGVQFLLKSAM